MRSTVRRWASARVGEAHVVEAIDGLPRDGSGMRDDGILMEPALTALLVEDRLVHRVDAGERPNADGFYVADPPRVTEIIGDYYAS